MNALDVVFNMTKYTVPSVKEIKQNLKENGPLFNVVSLFAGGGGSSTGYRMAGGEVLAINEFIKEAQNTYKANWPDTYIFKQDIRELTGQDILSAISKNVGELDILDGSPPCSAFSTAGSVSKGWGKIKKYSDANQECVENLFFEYIRILRDIQPKVFIAENVSGLSKGKAKGFLNEILRGLKDSGYVVRCKLLDARFLGIPQSRNRLIFVGVRNDLYRDSIVFHPSPQKTIVTLKDAFNGLKLTDKDIQETDLSNYKVYHLLKTLNYGEAHKKAFTLVKASPFSQSPCIKATTGKIGARESYHWDNRAFTVSELKRIMSLPDDYILTGTYSQQVERIGRMVAPFMMKAVAENVYHEVLKNENT